MGKRVSGSRRVGKEIRLLAKEAAFVGIDVHKKTYSVCVWTEGREWVAQWIQPADVEALCRRLEPVHSQIGRVVYEAGPTGFTLVRALRSRGFSADVVAPSKTPVAPGRADKCDRRDARNLARLNGKGMLSAIYVPAPQEEADRQVLRRRWQMVADGCRTQHRIKSFLLQHGIAEPAGLRYWSRAAVAELRGLALRAELRFCLDLLLDDLDHGRAKLVAAARKVQELAAAERHAADVARMRSVPGVGVITPMTFTTELPHPERFPTPEAIGAITGLAPRVRRSGESAKGGPILKTGNAHLRRVLVQSAWQWVRKDPAAKGLFGHLLGETGCKQKAIVAVARHLAILLWHLVTTESTYTPGEAAARDPEPAAAEA